MPIEQLIEQFVRFPESLGQAKVERARELLEESPEANEIATYYREYYGVLDKLNAPESRKGPIT